MNKPKVVSGFETVDLLTANPEYGVAIFGNTEMALFVPLAVKAIRPTVLHVRNDKPIGMIKNEKPRMI